MSKNWNIHVWRGTEPCLSNILNEVLHGFAVDHPKQLGFSRSELAALFEKVHSIASEQMFTPEEVKLLGCVARLCDAELGVEEFQTRTGYTLEESRVIQERLARVAFSTVHAAVS